jgi:hypothetical protein
LRRVIDRARGEIGEVVVGCRQLGVGEVGADVDQPFGLAEHLLLDVVGQHDHVEARASRVELDRRLLALLLLGHLLVADRHPGQRLEFLAVLLEEIAARSLGHQDLEMLALEALPVEAGCLRDRRLRKGGAARRRQSGDACSALQHRAPSYYPVRPDSASHPLRHCPFPPQAIISQSRGRCFL